MAVRWLADECVHSEVVDELRSIGHDVIYAPEVARRTNDLVLLQEASRDSRIFLTEDKGVGELVFRLEHITSGVVLLRFSTHRRALKWPRLRDAIAQYGDGLYGRFTVVDEVRTRSQALEGTT